MEFYLQGVPALDFQYEQINPNQLESLTQNANAIIARLEEAKKGAVIISTLMTRLHSHQYVRCTSQSVQITAASRYDPATTDMDLQSLDITAFVGIITYLPLPVIRSLMINPAAANRAAAIFENKAIDCRWTVYFSRLTFVNEHWAALFQQEIQNRLAWFELMSTNPDFDPNQGRETMHLPSSHPTSTESGHSMSQAQVGTVTRPPQHSSNELSPQSPPLSEGILLQVIRAKSSAWGPDHPTTIDSMLILVTSYISRKDFSKAKTLLEQALHACEKSYAPDSSDSARVKDLIADVDEHL